MATTRKPSRLARRILPVVAGVLVATLLGGCERLTSRDPEIWIWSWDMKKQPKYMPQTESAFFADHREQRRPPEGTVAVGYLKADDAFNTGSENGMYVGKNPLPIDAATLARGRERFDIYCAPCHSKMGDGKGIVPRRQVSWQPTNLHEERVRNLVDGELFEVISHGRRTMPGYRYQILERDRWAIVAYVRALQRAYNGTIEDIPPDQRTALK